MTSQIPVLRHDDVTLRGIKNRDARVLERVLLENRGWLQEWEASSPSGMYRFDVRGGIRGLLEQSRLGQGLPFVIELDGQFAGQLNVSGIAYGSLCTATIGYWVSEDFAGHGLTPTAVALATDYCFSVLGLHRMEICIRPENAPSLRVVQKLGFRYEGLRKAYIHINGKWADHYCFALVREEVPSGVLQRWVSGAVPPDAATVR